MKVVTLLIKGGALVPDDHRDALCKALESRDIEAVKRLTDLAVELLRRCLCRGCWVGTADGTHFARVRYSVLQDLKGWDQPSTLYDSHYGTVVQRPRKGTYEMSWTEKLSKMKVDGGMGTPLHTVILPQPR